MNNIIFGIKREYWEYKKLLLTVPLIVTAIFFLITMAATWTYDDSDDKLISKNNAAEIEVMVADGEGSSQTNKADDSDKKKDENQSFWFSGVYLATAWLAALFYALSSLYNDRKDKSILYWKTMPVSELQNILSKYLFSILGFSVVAIAISLICAVVLIAYSHLVFSPDMWPDDEVGMSLEKLIVWPILATLIALAWCAPVFSLALYVSARAKRMPILILLVPIILIAVVENIIFGTDFFSSFVYAHSPLGLVETISQLETSTAILKTYLVDSMPSLFLGLLLAAVFIWRAAWRRDHCFET